MINIIGKSISFTVKLGNLGYFTIIINSEGSGATNKGVTLSTWRQQGYDKTGDGKIDVEDLKLTNTKDVVEHILRPHYWNRWRTEIHT